MSGDVLSQAEVESLLSAMDSRETDVIADAATSRIKHRDKISPYDFKRPERVGKEQMRSLQTMHEAFGRNFGASLSAQVKGEMFTAKARHYDSALGAALNGSNLPEPIYRSLIAETNRGLPVLHRYFELRRRMLGLSDIGYWDIYPPLVKSDRTFSLAEMRQLAVQTGFPDPDLAAAVAMAESLSSMGWSQGG